MFERPSSYKEQDTCATCGTCQCLKDEVSTMYYCILDGVCQPPQISTDENGKYDREASKKSTSEDLEWCQGRFVEPHGRCDRWSRPSEIIVSI